MVHVRAWFDAQAQGLGPQSAAASKAAKAMYEIAEDDDVPLRVAVGADAVEVIKGKSEETKTEAEYSSRWNDIFE